MKNSVILGFLVILLAPSAMQGMTTLAARRAAAQTARQAVRAPKVMPKGGRNAAQTSVTSQTRRFSSRLPENNYSSSQKAAVAGLTGAAVVAGGAVGYSVYNEYASGTPEENLIKKIEKKEGIFKGLTLEEMGKRANHGRAFMMVQQVKNLYATKQEKEELLTHLLRGGLHTHANRAGTEEVVNIFVKAGANPLLATRDDGMDAPLVMALQMNLKPSGLGDWEKTDSHFFTLLELSRANLPKADKNVRRALVELARYETAGLEDSPALYWRTQYYLKKLQEADPTLVSNPLLPTPTRNPADF